MTNQLGRANIVRFAERLLHKIIWIKYVNLVYIIVMSSAYNK